jgi:hypothetical protein
VRLLLCLLVAGCHDWALLLDEPDLAVAEAPDLSAGCGRPAGLPSLQIQVAPGGLSLEGAIAQAQGMAGPAAILVAEGNYTANVVIDGDLAVYGGWYPDFRCRDPRSRPTVITSGQGGADTIQVRSGKVTLDGLGLVGLGSANMMLPVRPLHIKGGTVTLADCDVTTHVPLAGVWGTAMAVHVEAGATLEMKRCTLAAGSSRMSSAALVSQNAAVTVEDSHLSADNEYSGQRAAGISEEDNDTAASDGTLTVLRSAVKAVAFNGGARGIEVLGGRTGPTVISGSSVAGFDPGSAGVYLYRQPVLEVRGSTLHGESAVHTVSPLRLTLADSLLYATAKLAPITAEVTSAEIELHPMGNNLFSAPPVTLPADGGRSYLILQSSDETWDLERYRQIDPPAALEQGALVDGLHLSQQATAIDHASKCWEDSDIDGEHRPKNLICDVGGDER